MARPWFYLVLHPSTQTTDYKCSFRAKPRASGKHQENLPEDVDGVEEDGSLADAGFIAETIQQVWMQPYLTTAGLPENAALRAGNTS